jgi:5-amino-6-(5-phosphoribosylamino)uracil reductase
VAPDRPYTVLSCALSLDGFLDAGTRERLVLSNAEDLDRVDGVRATCDAILVGAQTVRVDDPRLLVRSDARRAERVARGLPPTPTKVTVTGSGRLDPGAAFFGVGTADRLVYCRTGAAGTLRRGLGAAATVVPLCADRTDRVDLALVCDDLARRGVRRLLVEGGSGVHTQFLASGLADELQLVIAPIFVGDPGAHRFVGPGSFPWHPGHRATLVDVRPIGDVALLRYALSDRYAATPQEVAR